MFNKLILWIYTLLQNGGEEKLSKVLAVLTAGATGAEKARQITYAFDYMFFAKKIMLSAVITGIITFTVTFWLGKLYKFLYYKYIKKDKLK